jgi:hypothetical protein
MAAASEFILSAIRGNKVTIFSWTYCPFVFIIFTLNAEREITMFQIQFTFRYCVKVKGLFDKLKVPYTAYELDTKSKIFPISNLSSFCTKIFMQFVLKQIVNKKKTLT